jgi:hypothetical protein
MVARVHYLSLFILLMGCPTFQNFDPGFGGLLLVDGERVRACSRGGCWQSDGIEFQRVGLSNFQNREPQVAVKRGEGLLDYGGDPALPSIEVVLVDGSSRSLSEGFGFDGPNHGLWATAAALDGSWMAVTNWSEDSPGCTKRTGLPCTKSFLIAQGMTPLRTPPECEAGSSSTIPILTRTTSGFRVVIGPVPGKTEGFDNPTGLVCSFDSVKSEWSIQQSPELEVGPGFLLGNSAMNEPIVLILGNKGLRFSEVRANGVVDIGSFSVPNLYYAVAAPSVQGKAWVAASRGADRQLSVWTLNLGSTEMTDEQVLGSQLSPQGVVRGDNGISYLLAADITDTGNRNKADVTPLVLFRHDGVQWSRVDLPEK